jgi:GT2 family glycosyltransferase/SAM-dependent methyltransferase
MKRTAHISVAISTCDRPAALSACLGALLAGEILPAEVIVVDQSRDGRTQAVVERYRLEALPLTYISHAGHGLGVSQNIAIARAQCPIIAVTDDDCVPAADWLATIEAAFAASSCIDAVTGRVLPLGAEQPGQYAVSSRVSDIAAEFDRNAMPWAIGSGNNFAVKRDWLVRIGGNDERLGPGSPGRGGVDMDLFYRLLRAGARIRYEPAALVYHERTSRAGRLSRRAPYGYGMGACCSKWLRLGDLNALRIFGGWMSMRLWRLAGSVRRRQWQLAYEELLVLGGTLGGLGYGLRLPKPQDRAPLSKDNGTMNRRLRRIAEPIMPQAVREWLWARWPRRTIPPVGRVRFGSLRRVDPISRYLGFDRGLPIDRYYIERFLATQRAAIQGRVLEVGDSTYTHKFGGSQVTYSDVLQVDPANASATIVADLAHADHIPSNHFDCIILTQTLQYIYDLRPAIQTLHRILKPQGVVLVTVPGISPVSHDQWEDSWCWGFSVLSARRLFEETFLPAQVTVDSYGNVLVAMAVLQGLSVSELRQEELDHRDPRYQVVITLRAVKSEVAP